MAKKKKNPGGRPTVMTPKTLDKLRYVFSIGGTKKEACIYARIGESTLYDYIEANPEFSEEIEALIQDPILKARKTVVDSLDDTKNAQWYLERKKKDEFSQKVETTVAFDEIIKEAEKYVQDD